MPPTAATIGIAKQTCFVYGMANTEVDEKKSYSLDYATGFSWSSFKKPFNEKSITVEQSKHFHWWENKCRQFCI